ncbi:hypothetical protein FOZ63_016873, partial [Perkinsus olseni]
LRDAVMSSIPLRPPLLNIASIPLRHCLSLRDAVMSSITVRPSLLNIASIPLRPPLLNIASIRDTILSALRSGSEKQYFLVAGLAGTGKTYLVKEILVELKKSMTPIVLCWAG